MIKEHKKLYKAGKRWLLASIVTIAGGAIIATTGYADDTVNSGQSQPSVAQVTDQNLSATNSATTQMATGAAVNRTINNVNSGWMDDYSLSRTASGISQLNVSGWHVAGQSDTEPYRWMLLYDNTLQTEVTRVPVNGNNSVITAVSVNRPDVHAQYINVPNSQQAGFKFSMPMRASVINHSFSLISRYSDDCIHGEGNHTDFWLPAMKFDMADHGNLDSISFTNNQLHVTGWHASNGNLGATKHVVILYDATQHRELARRESRMIARPDVAKVFPTVFNAGQSGFDVDFNLLPEMAHDQIQVISRYAYLNDEMRTGNDLWFAPRLLVADQSNRANLDFFKLTGNALVASGWHASNQAVGKKYHYIILFDRTNNHEVTRQNVAKVSRPDVAKVFPTILNANEAGFSARFNYDATALNGHQLQVISRWTDDAAGNGNATGYWFTPQVFKTAVANNGAGHLDSWSVRMPITLNGQAGFGGLTASGWHAANVANKPWHSVTLWDNTTHQVVGGAILDSPLQPAPVSAKSRPDVGRIYGNQYSNAYQSGFICGLKAQIICGHDFTLVDRYATDANDSNPTDYAFHIGVINQNAPRDHETAMQPSQPTTPTLPSSNGDGAGAVDKWAVVVNPYAAEGQPYHFSGIAAKGWHASNEAASKPWHSVILRDNTTGQEAGGCLGWYSTSASTCQF